MKLWHHGVELEADVQAHVSDPRPGTAGLPTGIECSRVGDSTWICPTSFVSTRIGVELADVLGT